MTEGSPRAQVSREDADRTLGRDFRLEVFEDYLRFDRGLADRTVRAYLADCRAFARFAASIDRRRPEQIDYETLRTYFQELGRRGLSARSAARHRSALRTYFGFLVDDGHLDTDPTERLEAPRGRATLPDTLSYEEVKQVLDTVAGLDPGAYRNASRDAAD